MTTMTIQRPSSLDGNFGSAVRLTVVGRSAPYVARKAKPVSTAQLPESESCVAPAGTAALHDNSGAYTVLIPTTPLRSHFRTQRLTVGLRTLAGVVLGVGVGGYLATEVATSHPLHINVASVAAVYCLIGLALVPLAYQELFGKLTVDSFGIRVAAGVFGFAIPWDELDRWSVDRSAFRFRSRKSGVTESVRIDHLSAGDCQLLLNTLKSCVPGREQQRTYAQRAGLEAG